MGIFQHKEWWLKLTGLATGICIIAGGFYVLKSASFLDQISEIPEVAFDCNTLNTNQVNFNGVANDTSSSEFPPNTLLDPLNLNDPYIEQQWSLDSIKAADLWRVTNSNSDITVAILDTGIDKYHEDLLGVVIAEINFTDSPTVDDINGHGTHIAGIIAAVNNNKGIAGLAPGVHLVNVKVADDTGRCHAKNVARGIVWAVDNGVQVINISLELVESSADLVEAVKYAWNMGVLVVAAAGNNINDIPVYPAGYENVLAVAALTMDDCLAPLSNHGKWVDVAAPGMNIYSLLPNNSYGYKTGTSFATAHVSGLAAVLFSIAVDTNGNGRVNDEVRRAIENSCDRISVEGTGNGRINAAAALAMIL
jgi:thermitase